MVRSYDLGIEPSSNFAEFLSPEKVYTFRSIGDYGIPKSGKRTHSTTKSLVQSLHSKASKPHTLKPSMPPRREIFKA